MRSLRERRIEKLETEKADLMAELEDLREKAETKAVSLEEEVAKLQEEAQSLKEMLDVLEYHQIQPPTKQAQSKK